MIRDSAVIFDHCFLELHGSNAADLSGQMFIADVKAGAE
jgi:hypothetical protein